MKEGIETEKEKEDFNYICKGLLKLIKSIIDFWTGCVLAMNSHFV